MKDLWKSVILGLSIIISVWVLSMALTYRSRNSHTIQATGLGEIEFTSDQIVWSGSFSVQANNRIDAYNAIERDKELVKKYLDDNGVKADEIIWSFANVEANFRSLYNSEGNYVGSTFSHYSASQSFTITSADIDKIEEISRSISSLAKQNVNISSESPSYYYTHLSEIKQKLIELASADAKCRCKAIADNAGSGLGKLQSANLGVFQITDPTGSDDYSYGGAFNTWSRDKKASITVRVVFQLK